MQHQACSIVPALGWRGQARTGGVLGGHELQRGLVAQQRVLQLVQVSVGAPPRLGAHRLLRRRRPAAAQHSMRQCPAQPCQGMPVTEAVALQ